MTKRDAKPDIEGLFTWPADQPQLIAGRCSECECYFFPAHAELHRPNCSGGPVESALLSRTGTLVSYTIQRYPPPPPFVAPDPYEPIAIGTVAFREGIQVPGQVIGWDLDQLRTGLEVEVIADTLYVDDEGRERLTWKFRPLAHAKPEN